MKRYLPFIIIGVVLIVAVGGAALMIRSPSPVADKPTNPSSSDASPSLPGSPTPPAAILRGAVPPHAKGPEAAGVLLEEFGDFQCPPCGLFHKELVQIEKEYGSRIRFVFREFPLAQPHKFAMDAARAAEAADMQGRFWAMHDLLYENQTQWSPMPDARPIFISYARSLGLDVQRFTNDMDSAEVAGRISADQARGASMGVKATPTLFVDIQEMKPTDMTVAGLRPFIDAALAKKGK